MNNLNYVFFEEFKHLDKLCGELYKVQYGITRYIDDMKVVSEKDYRYISNWKYDLEQLRRLRHIRNLLAHTEGAFNEEVCTQSDIDWLRNFHKRILNQTDSLALLYQNSKTKKQTSNQIYIHNQIIKERNKQIGKQPFRQRVEQVGSEANGKIELSHLIIFMLAAILALIVIGGIMVLFG